MALINMASLYKCRPSEIMGLTNDPYTAYCLDEACTYIKIQLDNEKQPKFTKKYSSFTDIYKNLQKGGVNVCP